MSKYIHKIDDIIKTLNSAASFYQDAKSQVKDPSIATLFEKMRMIKQQAVTRLTPFVIIQEGEPEEGNNYSVEARKIYANLLAKLSSDTDHTLVAQLEEVEDKTLSDITQAMDNEQPPEVYSTLREIYVDMKACHDEIHAVERATA
ncbi:hypothetical protein TDB9533_02491 [Thalassocella blandensis]|nr:hypothetical protein TDB9533_02491 [Thalassocella blandensis]